MQERPGGVRNPTEQAASAILDIGRTIDRINDIAANIASAVEEQGAATADIGRNVDEAAAAPPRSRQASARSTPKRSGRAG